MLKQTHKKPRIEFLLFIFFLLSIKSFGQDICTNYSVNPGTTISASGGGTIYNTTINVPDSYTITDVNVTVNITHTYNDDLDIFLISPIGTIIELSTDNGGSFNDYNNVTFDDDSGNTLPPGNFALTGDYQPEESLTGFNGENSSGNWILRIIDDANIDGGTINELILNLCYSLPTPSVNGNLGPGGVGHTDGTSNLVLWLNPDKGSNTGTTWTDQSGNSYDFGSGNGATLNTSDINGYNSYSFNGSNNYFEKSFESTLNPNVFSVFTVSNVSASGTYKAIVSSRDDSNPKGFILYAVPSSNNWSFWTGPNASWQTTGTTTSTVGSWATQNLFYQNSASGKRLFINNSLNATSTHSMTLNTTRPFRVGAGRNENPTPDYYFSGKMGEIIMFDAVLNAAQRIIVNNYLSAKYAFSLSSEDFYNEDTSGGNFDHNVAGIGRATDGSLHLDSQGTGIIRINTPSDLNNDEFLFWGEDVIDADYDFSSTVSTNYLERLDTKWRVSKRNDLGTVSVSVKASDITLSSMDGCNDLKLIVSSSSTFATKTTYDLVLSSGIYTATGVSFSDNDYFTIEYIDNIVLDGATAYNGSGGSNKPNTTDGCYKLIVKPNTLTLSENGDVREVEIEASSILAVNSGFKLQVTNGINNGGEIRLVGSSQLVQKHTTTNMNSGSGNLFVDQTASTSSIYHSGYWSSPVTTNGSSYTIDGILKDGTVPIAATSTVGEATSINFIAGHDGDASTSPIKISKRWLAKLVNADDWTRFLNPTSSTFSPGEGWNMKSMGASFTFKGRPNDGTYTIPISAGKFSLVGNPYPSALDSQLFIADNLTEINGTLYIYNSASDNTHVRSAYTGSYSTISTGVYIGAGRYLPIGQAFFVEGIATGSITFQNSQRLNIVIADTHAMIAKEIKKKKEKTKHFRSENKLQVLRIGFGFTTEDNFKYKRQLAVAFREGKTFKYENGYDAEMFDKKPSDLGLKIEGNDVPFVISSIQKFDEDIEIPLILELDKNRLVTFNIDALENFSDISIFLNDKLTGKLYNLSEKDISLDLLQGNYSDRFSIIFKYELLKDDTYEYVKLYHNKDVNNIIIRKSNPIDIQQIKIYDINGKMVFENTIEKQNNRLELLLDRKFSSGVYIIKLTTNKGVISQKTVF